MVTGGRMLVDGGGTTTRAALYWDGQIRRTAEGPSCNPRSVGRDTVLSNIAALTEELLRGLAGDLSLASVWFCVSTASTEQAVVQFSTSLRDAGPAAIRNAAEIWITNDIAPLLVHDGRIVPRVAAICGTGTGFCAINLAAGLSAHASGQEFLLADEGGAFDIGLRGLRSIVRSQDGRGERTSMTTALHEWRDVPVEGLFDLVYSSPEPKVLIASFARHVLAAAQRGDGCARRIVTGAVTELVTGIEAVAARSGLADAFEVVLGGSCLLADPAAMQDQLRAAVATALPQASVVAVAGTALDAINHLAELLPRDRELQRTVGASLPLVCLSTSDHEGRLNRQCLTARSQ